MSDRINTHEAPPPPSGYDFGKISLAKSLVSLPELRQLEATTGWAAEDAAVLRRHIHIFLIHAEEMVDSWRSVIGAQPHLAKWFADPDGKPDDHYKAKVKARFVQWVRDVPLREHDQAWLDYQEEIGLRHIPAKKNVTDGGHTPDCVPLRYIFAFSGVVALTGRRFFVQAGVEGEELVRLQEAWSKAIILHVTLWSRAYAREGLW